MMEAAVDYAETYRDAKDLVKLAVLAKGSDDVAKNYYRRALPEIKAASAKLDEIVGLLPK